MKLRSDRVGLWLSLAVAFFLSPCLAACEPVEPPSAESRFSLERVEVGVRFDESVRLVEGAADAVGRADSTAVVLTQTAEGGTFSASIGAVDTSGNESETRLEVSRQFKPRVRLEVR